MEDIRVIKTRKAIREAFISLMEEKGFQAMTVQDILDRAMVNRKTFYKYYRDKYDLADTIASEFLSLFDKVLSERFSSDRVQVMSAVNETFMELKVNKVEMRAIWKIRTDRIDVTEEMEKRLRRVYLELCRKYSVSGDTEFQAAMFSSVIISSYKALLERDQPFEAHKLMHEYKQLFRLIDLLTKESTARQ